MGQSAVQPDSQTDNFFSILLSLEFCVRILIVNLCSTLHFHIKNMMWLVFKQPKHRPFCRTMFFHVSGSVTTAHLIDGWGPLQKAHHMFGSGPSSFENNVDEVGDILIWPCRNPNPTSEFSFTPNLNVCSETGPSIHLSRICNSSAKDFITVSKSYSSYHDLK